MTIRNLDYECYIGAAKAQAEHQEDWLKTGYTSRGFYLKDFCLFKKGETWHLFHIAGTPNVSCCLPGNEVWFGHATTTDFCSWNTHLPCFYIDPKGWDCGHVFAPYVIEHDGKYWMYYTGVSIDNTQRIGVATSQDLFSWQRIFDKPIIRPEEYDWAFCPTQRGSACRDPHLFKFEDEFSLYYTAVTKEGRGCVARSISHDLLNWEDQGPVYAAPGLSHCESSNVQKYKDKYFLFFGGHYEYWSYVISDNYKNWPDQDPIPLRKHVTAMEVICKNEERWLVSYFKKEAFRMFLGVIDWTDTTPSIVEISEKSKLLEFGIATKK